MPKYRSATQNKRLWGLAAKLGLEHEDLRDYAHEYSGGRTDHTSKLYFNECEKLNNYLDGLANPKKEWSPRTVRRRRQKANVPQIATQKHLKMMQDLADKRGMSEDGLGDLSARVNAGVRKPRTSKEVNHVIEAIKAMNKRDRIFGAFKPVAGAGGSKEAA